MGARLPWVGRYFGYCCAVCGNDIGIVYFEAHEAYKSDAVYVVIGFCSNHMKEGKHACDAFRRDSAHWTIDYSATGL